MKKRKHLFVMNLELRNKRAILILSFLVIAVFAICCTSFEQNHTEEASALLSENTLIVIDAGHGGVDGGAVSINGAFEKDINLSIALKLRSILLLNGFDVIMTRDRDMSIYDSSLEDGTIRQKKVSDINNRISILNNNPNAILISIHQNTFDSPDVKGVQVFFADNDSSSLLGDIMQKRLMKDLDQSGDRPAKKAYKDIKLMNSIKNTGILIECGFLSNPEEESNLLDESYQGKIAFAIMSALYEYLGEN